MVSIIVPVYNSEMTISKCLDSIRKQTYRNLEIIVINDGSVDRSMEKVKRLELEDKRIKSINKKVRGGVSRARNTGLDSAKGDYIMFVDADDYLEVNCVEILHKALIQYRTDISICWGLDEFPNGKVWIDERKTPMKPMCFSVDKGYSYTTLQKQEVVWGALYKASILKNIRFSEDLSVGEDTLFFAMAAKNSKKIVHTYLRLYHYVQYEESAYHGKFSRKKYTELEAWKRVCKTFEDVPGVYVSAKCEYARVCYSMMKKYYRDNLFQQQYYKNVLKEYRHNVGYCFRSRDVGVFKSKR